MNKFFFLFLLLPLFASSALAQGMVPTGFALRPHLKSGQASIIRENVTFRVAGDSCHVVASYVLRNQGTYTEFLSLGLPAPHAEDVMNLRIVRDQQLVAIREWDDEIVVVHDSDGYDYSDNIPVHWWLWEIQIEPGQQAELVLYYSFSLQQVPLRLHGGENLVREFEASGQGLSGAVASLLDDGAVPIVGYAVERSENWDDAGADLSLELVNGDEPVIWSGSPPDSGQCAWIAVHTDESRRNTSNLLQSAVAEHPESRALRQLQLDFLVTSEWKTAHCKHTQAN